MAYVLGWIFCRFSQHIYYFSEDYTFSSKWQSCLTFWLIILRCLIFSIGFKIGRLPCFRLFWTFYVFCRRGLCWRNLWLLILMYFLWWSWTFWCFTVLDCFRSSWTFWWLFSSLFLLLLKIWLLFGGLVICNCFLFIRSHLLICWRYGTYDVFMNIYCNFAFIH